VLAPGLIDGDLHELDVFLIGGRGLRHRAHPEAELDVASHVVANARLVQAFQVGAVARDDDIAEPCQFCANPARSSIFPAFAVSALSMHIPD
jgi:hypothetical protein